MVYNVYSSKEQYKIIANGPVVKLAETEDLKSSFCGFESHRGYQMPNYPNWQRNMTQNHESFSSNLKLGTKKLKDAHSNFKWLKFFCLFEK